MEYVGGRAVRMQDSLGLVPDVWPSDFPPADFLIDEKEPCAAELAAAMADYRVDLALLAAETAGCLGLDRPTVKTKKCDYEGEFICDSDRDEIHICRLGFNCPSVTVIISILLHEIEHWKQSCRNPGDWRCEKWLFRGCVQRLADENGGYCAEPLNQPDCNAARGGNCAAAGRICDMSCNSVMGLLCYRQDRIACKTACLALWGCPAAPLPGVIPAVPLAPLPRMGQAGQINNTQH